LKFEHAFSDFSKLLFLKLLEEKADEEQLDPQGFRLPYSLRFDNIKNLSDDAIKASIHQMFLSIQKDKKYGEVLGDDIFYIQNSKTYAKIVKELAEIGLSDSDVDVKGSAFEYFLKFNLKGSQLGQYFTPRELVRLMIELADLKSIVLGLTDPKKKYFVIDPACGSGGFLITGMQRLIQHAKSFLKDGIIDEETFKTVKDRIKKEIFYGCDAKRMLVRTAKMNMIIAGDGFFNIKHGNSLTEEVPFLQISEKRSFPLANYVLANPPFGMSESELDPHSLELYDVHTTRGQALFLQKMIKIVQPRGLICTVIDEGILNTQSMIEIRQHILKTCFIEAVIHLPYVTFEPNYARVSTSVLLLRKKESLNEKQNYPIFMYDLKEIGYSGKGKPKGKASDEIIKDLVEKYKAFKNEYA
jgi:type I restriction enzyme M protein